MIASTAGVDGFVSTLQDKISIYQNQDVVEAHRIGKLMPDVVVNPKDIDELSLTMAAANENGITVAPWGGGTLIEFGNEIRQLDAVVDLSRMNRILSHNAGDLTGTVQAGTTFSSLQKYLLKENQFLPIDPPMPDRSTIGGTLAVGFSGSTKWHYWSPRDLVIGMKVVQADGTITKSGGQVVKNVSGYDMARLHVGGLGTLGIIGEVSFKLIPRPESELTLIGCFPKFGNAISASMEVFHSRFIPLAITSFDSVTNTELDIYEMGAGSYIAIKLGGRPRTLSRQLYEVSRIIESNGGVCEDVPSEVVESLWRKISDFGWGENAPVILVRVSIQPSEVSSLIQHIEQLPNLGERKVSVVIHPAHGIVQIGIFENKKSADIGVYAVLIHQIQDAVCRLNGEVVIPRCPEEIKTEIDVWPDAGQSMDIMRRLKDQYDPKGMLNPGRYVGGI